MPRWMVAVCGRALFALVLIFGYAFFQPHRAVADSESCPVQIQEMAQIKLRVDQHNARPHTFLVPEQQTQLDQYNAEKYQIERDRDAALARLQACEDAARILDPQGLSPQTKAPSNLVRARNALPSNVKQNSGPGPDGRWQVPSELRPLVSALRAYKPEPGSVLQGQSPPRIGQKDPAYTDGRAIQSVPGKSSTPDTQADHIVPVAEIVSMPGFTKLSADNMWKIATAPNNFQWLSPTANNAKNSGTVNRLSGPVDETWRRQQLQLQNQVRQKLREAIYKLLASQTG